MSAVTRIRAAEPAGDRSLEIANHIGTARAIADLVQIVAGGRLDGSDNRVDELGNTTLYEAMFAIVENLEAAEAKMLRSRGAT